MNWKGYGTKLSWPNLRYYTGIFLEGLRKITLNFSQVSRGLNLGSPEAEVLTSQPRSVVKSQ
jgi:hypothetical protein